MTQQKMKKAGAGKASRVISILLFALCAILLIVSVAGYVIRGLETTEENLNRMRTSAVLHAASGGLVDSIASEANAAKLKELRSLPDFRSMGMNEIQALCAEAEQQARAEAEALYGNTDGVNTDAIVALIDTLETKLGASYALEEEQKEVYAGIYSELYDAVADWTDFAGQLDDEALGAALVETVPALGEEENAYLLPAFMEMTRTLAEQEQAKDDEEMTEQLLAALNAAVQDWAVYQDVAADDEALWAELVALVPDLSEAEALREDLLALVHDQIETVAAGGTIVTEQVEETEAIEETDLGVDYTYFVQSPAVQELYAEADAEYQSLWAELLVVIPDLDNLDAKMQSTIQDEIEAIVNTASMDFSTRYAMYIEERADSILEGSDALRIKLAANAEKMLIAAIAVALLAFTYTFWSQLVGKMGVPRTIILLFFIYLCLCAQLYSIDVPLMLGYVLERVGMYGVLVLAMLPGIQCGIGLNMGMTIGCIAGLLSTVISLQYNMTGVAALVFSCVGGILIAIPLGWAYSLLLNRMKGSEMTISTYVGFSFVSLMCIGWMLLPFTNTKIIWLLSGKGLRVTHSLLGSFGHLLDEFLEFELFGATIPTGLLLFFLLCCFVVWLFSRTKTGIAMSAAGANPRFAEASGINVNTMRTIGTILSTVIAAVGIVIYSQAFGYAQLYTAPRQLGFIAASAILIGGATVSKAKVSHVIIGVFLFEGVLALGPQIANEVVAGGGLSEVMRIMISNGIILYALTQSGGAARE